MKAKSAAGAPIAMSLAAISPMPPARALPATRAITGLPNSQMRCSNTGKALIGCSSAGTSTVVRSIPEQKTVPVWLSTTVRTDSSASAASRADRSCPSSGADSALRRSGAFNVMVATEPAAR